MKTVMIASAPAIGLLYDGGSHQKLLPEHVVLFLSLSFTLKNLTNTRRRLVKYMISVKGKAGGLEMGGDERHRQRSGVRVGGDSSAEQNTV